MYLTWGRLFNSLKIGKSFEILKTGGVDILIGYYNCYITILDIYNKPRIKLRRFAETVGLPFTVNVVPGGTNYIINAYGNINVNIPLSTRIYPILIEFFEDYTSLTDETINVFFDKLLEYPFF